MFKFLVFSAVVAVACAAPHHSISHAEPSVTHWGNTAEHQAVHLVPVVHQLHHDDTAEVVVAAAAPVHHTTIVEQPQYAHVGSVVSHVPTAVSHQSRTDYHSEPVVKSVVTPVEWVQPVVHQHVVAEPIVHHHVQQVVAQPQIVHHVAQPHQLVYSAAPVVAHQQLVHAW